MNTNIRCLVPDMCIIKGIPYRWEYSEDEAKFKDMSFEDTHIWKLAEWVSSFPNFTLNNMIISPSHSSKNLGK